MIQSLQALGVAVYDTKVMEASHVLKDEDGNETLLPMSGKSHGKWFFLHCNIDNPKNSTFLYWVYYPGYKAMALFPVRGH